MLSKLVLTYLHKKGCTARKIAEKYKVSKTMVLSRAKDYGIVFINYHNVNPNTISPTVVKKLVRRGYSNQEIATLLGTNKKNISIIKDRHNLKSVCRIKKYSKPEESKELSLIIGCLLGDGSLDKNGRFSCAHSMKQRDYCLWKANQLESYNIKFIENNARFDKRTEKTYYCCTFYTRGDTKLKELRNQLYCPTKQLTKEVLKYYTGLSLAVHFMDDGYKKSSSYGIATNSFTKESLDTFIQHCKDVFQIKFVIHSENKLYLPLVFKDRFENIIRPYIHETLMYKLH